MWSQIKSKSTSGCYVESMNLGRRSQQMFLVARYCVSYPYWFRHQTSGINHFRSCSYYWYIIQVCPYSSANTLSIWSVCYFSRPYLWTFIVNVLRSDAAIQRSIRSELVSYFKQPSVCLIKRNESFCPLNVFSVFVTLQSI